MSKVALEIEISRVDGPPSSLADVIVALCVELDGYSLEYDDSSYALNVIDTHGYEMGERI